MRKHKIFYVVILFILLFSISGCGITASDNDTDVVGSNVNNVKTPYAISNAYFSLTTFKPYTFAKVNPKNGSTTYDYGLTCTSSCSVSLLEYTAVVKLYSSSNKLLHTETINKSKTISSNTAFSFDVSVSKQIQEKTTSVDATFTGKSYDKPGFIAQKYQVSFVYNNGTNSSKVLVEEGKTVSTPNDPQKTNYLFRGWYTESSLINRYDFSKPVTKNLTLYAKYEIDAVSLTNKISTDTIKGVVKIYNKNYKTFLGIETSSVTYQGSGFCFHIQNGYYYVLTNCHVAEKDSSYDKQKYTIEDYQGNTYEGYLYVHPNNSVSAIAASYDLACLYFKPTSTNVKSLPLASINPASNEDVISVGAPKGQSNFITFGNIINYQKITLSDTSSSSSNVTFDVIYHNAYVDHGSSGGPVFNANLNVVGVNYAGSASSKRGCAIPLQKINEFLRKYVYS